MTYCMSDLHGEKDLFDKMLEKIQFSSLDHLYILGDVIDRGPHGVELLGLHQEIGARELWRQNGGMSTYRTLLYRRTSRDRHQILRFLAGLPDHLDITVNEQKFHLVHGCPGSDREMRIWGRVDENTVSPYPDTLCIVGHTPTVFLSCSPGSAFSIWHGKGVLDIDCGCGHRNEPLRRLACLRLEDMTEFYVGSAKNGPS